MNEIRFVGTGETRGVQESFLSSSFHSDMAIMLEPDYSQELHENLAVKITGFILILHSALPDQTHGKRASRTHECCW